ncbi:hypothetical protein V6N13_053027 [Hibiscus sabdariffa]|uniref:Sieve element occlusion C-terminal domain-containing protein n=1 Tax=Hibiscus sabdariffa TaxID=183260 RepID=A0ABR2Q628_9ROSI
MMNGHSSTILHAMSDYNEWKVNVDEKWFDLAFKEHHDMLHDDEQPCCRFKFSINNTRISENIKCPECSRILEKYIGLLCCHEAD